MEKKISFAALAVFSLVLMLSAQLAAGAGSAAISAGWDGMESLNVADISTGSASAPAPIVYALTRFPHSGSSIGILYTNTSSAQTELGFVVYGSNAHASYICAAFVDGIARYANLNVKDGQYAWFMAGKYKIGEHQYLVKCKERNANGPVATSNIMAFVVAEQTCRYSLTNATYTTVGVGQCGVIAGSNYRLLPMHAGRLTEQYPVIMGIVDDSTLDEIGQMAISPGTLGHSFTFSLSGTNSTIVMYVQNPKVAAQTVEIKGYFVK